MALKGMEPARYATRRAFICTWGQLSCFG